jgi:putative transcriptional regulator
MKNILKEIRKKEDLTQTEIGNLLNVSRGTIAQIEVGKNKITTELAKKISEKFNYSIDFILNYTGEDLIMIHSEKGSYVEDFFKDIRLLDIEIDKLFMLQLIIKEFSNEKKLKGITPAFDRFSDQNKLFEIINEFKHKTKNNLIDDVFEKKCAEKIRFAIECLFDDLYNNMSVAYGTIHKYYKNE